MLAAVGIYGVMSFSVNQRTQEFGVRMALGADCAAHPAMVLRQGAVQLGARAVARPRPRVRDRDRGGAAISNTLFGVSARDPFTFIVVVTLVTMVSVVAMLVPARRATRVDPMIALRAE